MSDEATIQHKAPHRPVAGFGFEDGALVPVAVPTDDLADSVAPADGLDIEEVLSLILSGTKDARQSGERLECLAYRMSRVRGRATTLRELGRRLGCSHENARRICDKRCREFAKELKEISPSL